MIIIGIDPGNELSGYVMINTESGYPGKVMHHGKVSEKELKRFIESNSQWCKRVGINMEFGIEMIASYGMAVGQTVFNTCAVIGRLEQFITSVISSENSILDEYGINEKVNRIFRKRVSVKGINSTTMELCHTTRAKDKNIRQAILDLYPPTGGGKTPQVGTKKQHGPLYGVSGDAWQALGIALTLQSFLSKN